MASDVLRSDFTRLLTDYLAGREAADSVARWTEQCDMDRLDEPLRRDVEAVRETARDVRAGQRGEDELRDLAEGLARDIRE
jgi:hypothetical protein